VTGALSGRNPANTLASILVIAGFQLGSLILLEATSRSWVGAYAPTPAWGEHACRSRKLPERSLVDGPLPRDGLSPLS